MSVRIGRFLATFSSPLTFQSGSASVSDSTSDGEANLEVIGRNKITLLM